MTFFRYQNENKPAHGWVKQICGLVMIKSRSKYTKMCVCGGGGGKRHPQQYFSYIVAYAINVLIAVLKYSYVMMMRYDENFFFSIFPARLILSIKYNSFINNYSVISTSGRGKGKHGITIYCLRRSWHGFTTPFLTFCFHIHFQ